MCDDRSKTDPIESRVRNGQRRTESTINIACTVWRIARLTSNREFQKIRKFTIFGNLLKLLWEFAPANCEVSHKTARRGAGARVRMDGRVVVTLNRKHFDRPACDSADHKPAM
jgi:hypothetical protein